MTDFLKHPRLDVFQSELVKDARFSATYEFPLLERTYFAPEKAIPFEKASKAADHQQWVHFYTHDRNFECVWRYHLYPFQTRKCIKMASISTNMGARWDIRRKQNMMRLQKNLQENIKIIQMLKYIRENGVAVETSVAKSNGPLHTPERP